MRRFVPPLLRPGWPDEARRVVQEPVFRAAAAEGPPRGRCLNAGCGEGLYGRFLESFQEIAGIVNIDITMPQISRRRSDPRHTDAVGSVTELPLEDGSLDWIPCTEVIEDDRAAAVELGRVLKSGGFALISVPKPPAPLDPAHVREGYSLEGLRELLLQGCLEVIWHRYWVLLSPPDAMAGRRLALAARASRWRTPEPDAAVGRARVRLRGPLARHRASMGSRGPREETVSDYPDLDAHVTLERDAPPYRRG